MLRITVTAYAERLLADLSSVDWPDSTKRMQEAWIGRSEGAEIAFSLEAPEIEVLRVFTTRPDTLFGCTYMVLAPEHPLVDVLTVPENRAAVAAYRRNTAAKSDLERTDLAKEKSGVFIGAFAINPANRERIPIWIADYVLMGYGTGAIMAVPAHDDRDLEFARQYGLEIRQVIEMDERWIGIDPVIAFAKEVETAEPEAWILKPSDGKITETWSEGTAFTSAAGRLVNSDDFNGLSVAEAQRKIVDWLLEKGSGKPTVNYKLRDWLFLPPALLGGADSDRLGGGGGLSAVRPSSQPGVAGRAGVLHRSRPHPLRPAASSRGSAAPVAGNRVLPSRRHR